MRVCGPQESKPSENCLKRFHIESMLLDLDKKLPGGGRSPATDSPETGRLRLQATHGEGEADELSHRDERDGTGDGKEDGACKLILAIWLGSKHVADLCLRRRPRPATAA